VIEKSKPVPNYREKKSYYSLPKVRFIRHIKVSLKHYNIIRW